MRTVLRIAPVSLGLAALAAFGACAGRGRPPVGSPTLRSVETVRAGGDAAPPSAVSPRGPRTLALASSRALALDATNVYFGDAEDDVLLAVDRRTPEAEPRRIARGAPTAGALAYDSGQEFLAWIASPGDVVLRVPVHGGTPKKLRDRGIFTDVATSDGDVFLTEVQGRGGFLTRITGTTAARLASFGGTPRGIAVDRERVYVATSTQLSSAPRKRGASKELASGAAFDSPNVDEAWVYAVKSTHDRGRSIVRLPKNGGPLEVLAGDVRDAPIALAHGVLYWFDAARPALLAADAHGPVPLAPRIVSTDPILEHPTALAVDEDGVVVAASSGEDARIVAIPIP